MLSIFFSVMLRTFWIKTNKRLKTTYFFYYVQTYYWSVYSLTSHIKWRNVPWSEKYNPEGIIARLMVSFMEINIKNVYFLPLPGRLIFSTSFFFASWLVLLRVKLLHCFPIGISKNEGWIHSVRKHESLLSCLCLLCCCKSKWAIKQLS